MNRRQALGALIGLMLGALVVGTLTVVVRTWSLADAIRETQTEGTPTGRRIVRLSELVVSCVEPGGECFERNQQNQAAVIAQLTDLNLFSLICDRKTPGDVPRTQACVRALAEAGKRASRDADR